jgi:galactose mutarotase-like enzyme
MPEIKNSDQCIVFSECGGNILSWKMHGKDILYPQQHVRRNHLMKLRGGIHACFPNFGRVNQEFGLPQHGPLRARKADVVMKDGVVFRGFDLLGTYFRQECAVIITIDLTDAGFQYSLMAKLLKPPKEIPHINAGFHPYFRTPTGKARVGTGLAAETRLYRRAHGPRNEPVGKEAFVQAPSLGVVRLLLGGAFSDTPSSKRLVVWRDSEHYACAEPILGVPQAFGTSSCVPLTEKWFRMSCEFQFTPE